MARTLSEWQRAGFKLFFEERPDGIPWDELKLYKQTTIGSLYYQGWIVYDKYKDRMQGSEEGRAFLEAYHNQNINRLHPYPNLSQRIKVKPLTPEQRNKENESATTKVSRSAKKSAARPPRTSHRGSVRRAGRNR